MYRGKAIQLTAVGLLSFLCVAMACRQQASHDDNRGVAPSTAGHVTRSSTTASHPVESVDPADVTQSIATQEMASLLTSLLTTADPAKNPSVTRQAEITALKSQLADESDPANQVRLRVRLAMMQMFDGQNAANLRLAEEQNCILNHNHESCIIPIRLGDAHVISKIAIDWPISGSGQTFDDVQADQCYEIHEGDATMHAVQLRRFAFSNH